MKHNIQVAAGQVIDELERYMIPLSSSAALAPSLGLVGTVIGFTKVFPAILLQGTGNTGVLAGGISEALITTAAGMTVAIPAIILQRYFLRRIDTLVVTMEEEASKLVDALHSDRRVDIKNN